MDKRFAAVLTIVGVIAAGACADRDHDETSTVDTTTVQGMDTVNQPVAVPTTDTVVRTTTTDTIHGDATDTTHADTMHHDTMHH